SGQASRACRPRRAVRHRGPPEAPTTLRRARASSDAPAEPIGKLREGKSTETHGPRRQEALKTSAAQLLFICRLVIRVGVLRWFVIQKQTDGASIAVRHSFPKTTFDGFANGFPRQFRGKRGAWPWLAPTR